MYLVYFKCIGLLCHTTEIDNIYNKIFIIYGNNYINKFDRALMTYHLQYPYFVQHRAYCNTTLQTEMVKIYP